MLCYSKPRFIRRDEDLREVVYGTVPDPSMKAVFPGGIRSGESDVLISWIDFLCGRVCFA